MYICNLEILYIIVRWEVLCCVSLKVTFVFLFLQYFYLLIQIVLMTFFKKLLISNHRWKVSFHFYVVSCFRRPPPCVKKSDWHWLHKNKGEYLDNSKKLQAVLKWWKFFIILSVFEGICAKETTVLKTGFIGNYFLLFFGKWIHFWSYFLSTISQAVSRFPQFWIAVMTAVPVITRYHL